MGYLIDTNIAIHARDGHVGVSAKLVEHDSAVFLSSLSLAELQRGFYSREDVAGVRRMRTEQLLLGVPVLPFDEAAARAYGGVVAVMGWSRTRDFDRLIAAHAIATRHVLVTANVADFTGVPGLAFENWVNDP